jgi:predicted nuclease of predicted toxin-antitoxin system
MPQTIRFHLDEHCPTALAEALRRRGIDVATAADAGLLHAPDEDHIASARTQGRMIFTQDADFLRLHAAGADHSGIAYCHQQALTLGQIIQGLVLIWDIYEPEEMCKHVEWL